MRLVNHVSQFDSAAALHHARMAAIQKVTTPAFVFVDDTDAFFGGSRVPEGLAYGGETIYAVAADTLEHVTPKAWSAAEHLYQPHLIHRAICNTAAAKKVLEYLPQGDYYTEWLLYYFVAANRGAEMVAGDFYHWAKETNGMHTQVSTAIGNTSLWLLQNHRRVLAELKK